MPNFIPQDGVAQAVFGVDPATGKPLAGGGAPAYGASGTTAVASAALVVNTPTAAISPKAGRTAYAWLTGSGSASGYFIFSKDGTNWFQDQVAGQQLATWTYTATANVGSQAIAGQMVVIPIPDQAGLQVKLLPTSVTGAVNAELTQ